MLLLGLFIPVGVGATLLAVANFQLVTYAPPASLAALMVAPVLLLPALGVYALLGRAGRTVAATALGVRLLLINITLLLPAVVGVSFARSLIAPAPVVSGPAAMQPTGLAPAPTSPVQSSPSAVAPEQPTPVQPAPAQPAPAQPAPAQPAPAQPAPAQPSPSATSPAQPSPSAVAPPQFAPDQSAAPSPATGSAAPLPAAPPPPAPSSPSPLPPAPGSTTQLSPATQGSTAPAAVTPRAAVAPPAGAPATPAPGVDVRQRLLDFATGKAGPDFPVLAWRLDSLVLLGVGLLLFPAAIGRYRVGRIEGALLFCAYLLYVIAAGPGR